MMEFSRDFNTILILLLVLIKLNKKNNGDKMLKKKLSDAQIIIRKLNFSEKGYTTDIINKKADEIVNSSLKAFEYMAKIQNIAENEREKEKERLVKEKILDPFLNSY